MSSRFAESIVEDATLDWFGELGYSVLHGPEIAPGELAAERAAFGEVVLEERLRAALRKLNPALPAEALDEAFRKVAVPQHPSLIANNRAFHRMLVDGVAVEYRRKDGSIGAEIVRLIDFDDPEANDWLAVNQFTVVEGQHNRRPDVVLFVNGLPLAVIELKNAADENADDLDGVQPAPDLQAADPVALRLQRGAGRLRRRGGAHRHAQRRTRNGSCRGAPSRARRSRRPAMPQLEVLLRGRVRQAPVPRPGPPLHRVRG